MFVLTLIFLPRRIIFFEPEDLKNGIKFKNGKAFRESAFYSLALAGHKKRIISYGNDEKTDFRNHW